MMRWHCTLICVNCPSFHVTWFFYSTSGIRIGILRMDKMIDMEKEMCSSYSFNDMTNIPFILLLNFDLYRGLLKPDFY